MEIIEQDVLRYEQRNGLAKNLTNFHSLQKRFYVSHCCGILHSSQSKDLLDFVTNMILLTKHPNRVCVYFCKTKLKFLQ